MGMRDALTLGGAPAAMMMCSTIRKVLLRNGYKWLPRAQKPRVGKKHVAARLQFAKAVLRFSRAELRRSLACL